MPLLLDFAYGEMLLLLVVLDALVLLAIGARLHNARNLGEPVQGHERMLLAATFTAVVVGCATGRGLL